MDIIYSDIKTINGFACDVVISGLQKFVRRADIPRALACANELALSNGELFEYMWSRLMVISVEDIGLGDPMASVRTYDKYQQHIGSNNDADAEKALYYEAIIDLCGCNKERGSCILAQLIRTIFQSSNAQANVEQLYARLIEGDAEKAALTAYAIANKGSQYYQGIWECLQSFAKCELAFEPNAAILVDTLNRMRSENYKDSGIHPMYFTHAIRYLCCLKNGTGLCLKEHSMTEGEACPPAKLEFPSYVFDKHTLWGQEHGRDELHFLKNCATVIPEVNVDGNDWTHRLIALIEGGLYA